MGRAGFCVILYFEKEEHSLFFVCTSGRITVYIRLLDTLRHLEIAKNTRWSVAFLSAHLTCHFMPSYRNPVTGKWRRCATRDLPRKHHAGALDVNSCDFLKNTVHPAISYWTRQGSECIVIMFTLLLVQNNILLQLQNDGHLDKVLEWIDKETCKYMCGVA
jgi:hypothetical protein